MKSKKGFTLVEIIVVVAILVVIAGIFSVNMINTLNKNKEEENKSVVTQITSAADAYVSTNPEEVERLYNGYGYVDIKVGELRDNGLLSEELKNPETGERISDDEIVRVRLELGDNVGFTYPLSEEEKNAQAWSMIAQDLTIDYSSTTTSAAWCSNDKNKYSGLYDSNYVNKGNYADVTSKLYLEDNSGTDTTKGKMFDGDYFADAKLEATSCNVNPQVAGSYIITYKYTDPSSKVEKTMNRNVHVATSTNDVISFTAVINEGKKIMLGATNVPIAITETYKDGKTATFESTTNNLGGIKYSIEKFDTSKVGTRNAYVSTMKTNSDGSRPESQQPSYTVTDSFVEIIGSSPECTPQSGSECYFRGEQEGNYVNYYGKIFRIYYINKDTNNMKIVFDGNYITAPYGQIGGCISSCCNNGRRAYISLGDDSNGFGNTMDSHLNNFYVSLNGGGTLRFLQSQSFRGFYNAQDYSLRTNNSTYANELSVAGHITTNAIKERTMSTKVSLLQLNEYANIANCTSRSVCKTDTVCTDSTSSHNNCFTSTFCTPEYTCADSTNYLNKGSNFWLLEFYSARLGVGAYNSGVSAAEAKEFMVTSDGGVSNDGAFKPVGGSSITTASNGVRPTLLLNNPKIISGNGTKETPYVISR